MKKMTLTALCLLFLALGSANAAITFDITTNYLPGDSTATYGLTLASDNAFILEGLNFDFAFDQTELTFVSHENYGEELFGSSYEEVSFFGALNADQVNGRIESFYIGVRLGFGFDPIEMSAGTYELGSFLFNVDPGAALDGTSDFFMTTPFLPFLGITEVDSNGNTLATYTHESDGVLTNPMTYVSDVGNAAPIPVPGAIWLLGSGLLGLVGWKRRSH